MTPPWGDLPSTRQVGPTKWGRACPYLQCAHEAPFEHMTDRGQNGMRPGGFGFPMTRVLVDEVMLYKAHNEVVFVKYLD